MLEDLSLLQQKFQPLLPTLGLHAVTYMHHACIAVWDALCSSVYCRDI